MGCIENGNIAIRGNLALARRCENVRRKNWDRDYKAIVPYFFKWRDKNCGIICACKEIIEAHQSWYGFSYFQSDECAIMQKNTLGDLILSAAVHVALSKANKAKAPPRRGPLWPGVSVQCAMVPLGFAPAKGRLWLRRFSDFSKRHLAEEPSGALGGRLTLADCLSSCLRAAKRMKVVVVFAPRSHCVDMRWKRNPILTRPRHSGCLSYTDRRRLGCR
jgi:hypothetical protein